MKTRKLGRMVARAALVVGAGLAVLCACSLAVAGELVVRKGPISKALVAVPDFTEEGRAAGAGLSTELSKVLRFDLDHCGYYSVVADGGVGWFRSKTELF